MNFNATAPVARKSPVPGRTESPVQCSPAARAPKSQKQIQQIVSIVGKHYNALSAVQSHPKTRSHVI